MFALPYLVKAFTNSRPSKLLSIETKNNGFYFTHARFFPIKSVAFYNSHVL